LTSALDHPVAALDRALHRSPQAFSIDVSDVDVIAVTSAGHLYVQTRPWLQKRK
jgi:hypothetical protein